MPIYDEAIHGERDVLHREGVKEQWDTSHMNEEATVEVDLPGLTWYLILCASQANRPPELVLHFWFTKCEQNEIVALNQ